MGSIVAPNPRLKSIARQQDSQGGAPRPRSQYGDCGSCRHRSGIFRLLNRRRGIVASLRPALIATSVTQGLRITLSLLVERRLFLFVQRLEIDGIQQQLRKPALGDQVIYRLAGKRQ